LDITDCERIKKIAFILSGGVTSPTGDVFKRGTGKAL
jgi:hypothetical protein